MKKIIKTSLLLISLVPAFLSCKAKSEFAAKPIVKSVGKIDVMVDPNVEMMMILGRIAGAGPYADDVKMNEAYVDDVDEYFKDFKYDRAAIMVKSYQLEYQGLPEFGMYLNEDDSDFVMKVDNENFLILSKYHIGFDQAKNVPYCSTDDFREAVRAFRKSSDFDRFFLEHQKVYEDMIDQTCQYLNNLDFPSWYEDFYGIKLKKHGRVFMTYISAGANWGISIRNKKGDEIPSVVVCGGQGNENFTFLLSHEFSHPKTRPIDLVLAENEKLITKFNEVYQKYPEVYLENGYLNGYSILVEMVNQACANKFLESVFDEKTMDWVNRELILGFHKFIFTPQLADFLDNYLNDRKRYKTLMDFEPELEKFLETVEE